MRHRRYPVKKTTKIKASDPVSKGKGFKNNDLGRKNRPPTLDEIDHQMVPRKLKDIERAQKAIKEGGDNKRRNKKVKKNKFLALTSKMGFNQRPWEDEAQLTRRIMRTKNKALDDELIKVKAGTAGRDAKELEQEFKQLDESDKRKKLAKIAFKEKKLKLKEKEEKFKESKMGRKLDMNLRESADEVDLDDDTGSEFGSDAGAQKETSKKKRRLNKRERKRLERRIQKEDDEKDLMLNAREIIPFGETVDAPPKFESFRKTMDPLYAQAGNKDLLLKKLMSTEIKKTSIGTPVDETTFGKKGKQKVDDEKRLNVILAYRELKKKKVNRF